MVTDMKIIDEIIAQLRTIVPATIEITPQSSIMGDLGLDSLTVMNFVMSLEDTMDISLPLDCLADAETVADLAQAIQAQGAKGSK